MDGMDEKKLLARFHAFNASCGPFWRYKPPGSDVWQPIDLGQRVPPDAWATRQEVDAEEAREEAIAVLERRKKR